MSLPDLPTDWQVWNAEPDGRVILTFRPDVFTEDDYPAECLPTIYVTNGSRKQRPGAGQYQTENWHVALFLEPEIEVLTETFGARNEALDGAVDVADRFVAGDVDPREHYQVPREEYFAALDRLTGDD